MDEDNYYDISTAEEEFLLNLATGLESQGNANNDTNNNDTNNNDTNNNDTNNDNDNKDAIGEDDIRPTEYLETFHTLLGDESAGQIGHHNLISYPNLQKALAKVENDTKYSPEDVARGDLDPVDVVDNRSPLERFRSYPRRPLTVTDLTSGAWCEMQYWYTLTRLPGGRRTKTVAMRQGSKVHQKLEDEVHTTVRIEITSKEDGFGLRLWNFIQGLRTLRDTGLTRELEVWGMVDGNLVNGVIDGVSYEHPNPDFEQQLSQESKNQSKLTDYFGGSSQATEDKNRKIYLTDVKTRGTTSPVSKALLRPAKIQLMLYHRFLSDIAAEKLDFLKVLRRYGLNADEPFTDSFIAQIGSLHDEIFAPVGTASNSAVSSSDTIDLSTTSQNVEPDLVQYRSLRELLRLVEEEVKASFPLREQSMGNILRVQYVLRKDGRDIDIHDFPVSPPALEVFLEEYMQWWRGERAATGVEIEETFKCRTCEFVDDCEWRRDMHESLNAARAKTAKATGHS